MTKTEIAIKMVLDRWHGSVTNLNRILSDLTDAQLQMEIVPGKNNGTYLLGHLIAVHDDMLILLGMGEKLYPALFEPFIKQPFNAAAQLPSVAELKAMWIHQHKVMQQKFSSVTADEWFGRHTAVSEDEFLKEPHRNKLNIIITRTSHLQYHSGQIVLLKTNKNEQ
ncbi:MAG: DinB family protein [Bacteroidetes bacterium]|nr:DinB family protein [Bacteroidota bacterium]